MDIRTPIAKVRGLGTAKEGVAHFWTLRVSAIALVPLTVWFLASAIAYVGAGYNAVVDYLRQPVIAVLFILFLACSFIHMRLGVQEVIIDYIRKESTKVVLMVLLNFYTVALAALSIFAVLKIAFQSP